MNVYVTLSNLKSDESWKKKIPLIDGFGTEGIGSMIQYHLLLFYLSDFTGIPFTYPGSKNFAHHSYTEYSEDNYFEKIDTFFNFPKVDTEWDEVHDYEGQIDDNFFKLIESYKSDKKVLVNLHNCHRAIDAFCGSRKESIFTKDRVDRIRNNLVFNDEGYFQEGRNICWHMRTPNPNDIPAEIVSPYREYYVKDRDFLRYKTLVDFIKNNSRNTHTTLHIHSQGFSTDFSEFLNLRENNFDIRLHIDDHPTSDIYHMSHANIFIMSNSAFSYVPSLLSSNKKLTRNNYHTWTFNSIQMNYNFTEFTGI